MIPYPPPGPGHPTTQEKARAIIHRYVQLPPQKEILDTPDETH